MFPWVEMILTVWENAHIVEIDGVMYVEYWPLIEEYMSVCLECAGFAAGVLFVGLALAFLLVQVILYAAVSLRRKRKQLVK